MFIAIDSNGVRIDSSDAIKDEIYFCPICHAEVQLKKGEINAPYFAHLMGTCSDTWNYDMSEWHKKMQGFFPKEYREVVVKLKNCKHRADILINNIVVEFQQSPISITEFDERNAFFKNAGYRLAWVFDFSKQYRNENIYCKNKTKSYDYLMRWKHPKKIFSNLNDLYDKNKRFSLWFSFFQYEDESFQLYKVIWSPNNGEEREMNRFIVSQYEKKLEQGFNLEELFYSKEENFKPIHQEAMKNPSIKIKYSGINGKDRNQYICEKRNRFGINLYYEIGCL